MNAGQKIWSPGREFVRNSRLNAYRDWLNRTYDLEFDTYRELWQWSVDKPDDFWLTIWEYFDVKSNSPFNHIRQGEMPDTRWFEGSTLNYAEHVFWKATRNYPAILFQSERHPLTAISWEMVTDRVSRLSTYLKSIGVRKGDRIGAFLPNIPGATYGFLATCALGAVWSSCSPDFGTDSVVDRFLQIEPKVLICIDGYHYGGKKFDRSDVVREIVRAIPSIERVIVIPYLYSRPDMDDIKGSVLWDSVMETEPEPLSFEPVPFDHPVWVLYSSGTTGQPKAITHSHGGVLLEHFKYLAFHNDVHAGEKFFWYSTTGWMMWNFVQAALLHGATIVLYDGSPGYPDLNVMWRMAAEGKIQHFGTSAPYLIACMKQGQNPGKKLNLQSVRSVSSTGAPLPPEAFEWVYDNVHENIWLCSMSGGTDVCTAFVGGCPERPVHAGEIQCRALGCSLYAFDEKGNPVDQEVGEMVITKAMPSMPVYFWNDPDKKRYRDSYFDLFPGVWRHGDWVKITEHDGLMIFGRSDATLNRQGVRIGTAEIYRALHVIEAVADALIVHLDHEGRDYMPLFVVLDDDTNLSGDLKSTIKSTLRSRCSPRHVPDDIIEVDEIPYTISGKKMEAPVKKVLAGTDPDVALNRDAMRNPEAMDFFIKYAEEVG